MEEGKLPRMVAEVQRLEDAARTAMGDYSSFSVETPVRAPLLGGLAAGAAKTMAVLGRAVGRLTP